MTDAPPLRIDDLPEVATPAQVRKVLNLSSYQMQCLIRERRIGYIPIGSRVLIPRESVRQFIADNTLQPERPSRTFDSGSDRTMMKARPRQSAVSREAEAAASKARGLATIERLKACMREERTRAQENGE